MAVTLDPLHDVVDAGTLEILNRRSGVRRTRRRGWLVRRALLTADLVSLTASFLVAEWVFKGGAGHFNQFGEYALFLLALPAWTVAAKLYGLYDGDEERTDHSTTDDFAGVFHLVTVITWLIVAIAYLTPVANPELPKLILFWAAAVTTIPLARAASRSYCRGRIHYLQNTIILGAGDVGQSLAARLLKHPEYGLNLVGFVDDHPREPSAGLEHLAQLGSPDDLPNLIQLLDVERVIFAFSENRHEELLQLTRDLNDLGAQVDIVPRLFEVVGPGVEMHMIEGMPVVALPPFRLSRSSTVLKRALDGMLSTVAIIVLAPVFLAIALLIKLDSSGPVFFRQVRAGRGSDLFRIWKFRTMICDAESRKDELRHLNVHLQHGGDGRMFKVHNDPRVTRVGRVLRKTSLDELPQLFNVLIGEMSLVGPRPLVLEEDRYVRDWGRRRLDLRPGMTGLWQVLGRSDIPFEEMVRLDCLYVTSWSVFNDLQLLVRTVPLLFRRPRTS